MYRIATFSVDSNCMFADIDTYERGKSNAIKEYWRQVKEAFNGEVVICYNNDMMKSYPDIMPQLSVSKKRDWRYGEEMIYDGCKHRKQYLKYKYLGKLN